MCRVGWYEAPARFAGRERRAAKRRTITPQQNGQHKRPLDELPQPFRKRSNSSQRFFHCNEEGYLRNNCPHQQSALGQQARSGQQCYKCGQTGHRRRKKE
eukprot:GHVN01105938.1.p1 GENE.GHVN01105938.1~~GHVN01105938.1.p1  ORF type:complete len:100 (-),score=8.86 GHVN01105938.1:147-446(-)